jgi:hypothetical protein
MTVNYELERMWIEVAVAYFKVLTRHLHRGTEEDSKKAS